MTRPRRLVLTAALVSAAAGLLMIGATLPGCAAPVAGTPAAATTQPLVPATQTPFAAAATAFQIADAALTVAEAAGVLDPSELSGVRPYLDAARDALAAYEADSAAGRPVPQTAVDAVSAALVRLRPVLRAVGSRKAATATP